MNPSQHLVAAPWACQQLMDALLLLAPAAQQGTPSLLAAAAAA
jgi:hypothetical protein